jgi:hypothetical protein
VCCSRNIHLNILFYPLFGINTNCFLFSKRGMAFSIMQKLVHDGLMVPVDHTPAHSRCFPNAEQKQDFAPTSSTSNVVKHFLASADDVQFETRLQSLQPRHMTGGHSSSGSGGNGGGGWTATSRTRRGKQEKRHYDAVVLCMPPSNALRVLKGGLKKQFSQQTKHVKWTSRFSLALWFSTKDRQQATAFIQAASAAHQTESNVNLGGKGKYEIPITCTASVTLVTGTLTLQILVLLILHVLPM